MRSFVLLALTAALAASPGFAAQTYTVPVTVVPGSITFLNTQGLSAPFSEPFNFVLGDSQGTCTTSGTVSGQLVSGGIELQLDVTATGNGPCRADTNGTMEVEVVVPEFPGTVTMVWFERVPLTVNLPPAVGFTFGLVSQNSGSSDSTGGIFFLPYSTALLSRSPNQPLNEQNTGMIPLIPGDTVRIPFSLRLNTADSTAYSGTIRVRYELKVTVPEPTASLSLPIGVLTAFGLASRRG